MNIKKAIEFLQQYKTELEGILGRFTRSSDALTMALEDDSRFHQMVLELRDFYDDILGENTYSSMTVDAYNEGAGNYLRSPSFASVQRVIGIVSSVITRLERNPDLLTKADDLITSTIATQKPLTIPEKVTLMWLFNHVPFRIWAMLIGFLIAAFSFGAVVTSKLSFVQEWLDIKVEEIVK